MRIFIALMLTLAAFALSPAPAEEPLSAERLRAMANENPERALSLFREFLAFPNDAAYPEDILELLAWLEPQFSKRGFDVRRISTEGSPVLFAERKAEGAPRTALIYLQADGQPVDPSLWTQPSPWTAVMKKPEGDQWAIADWPATGATLDPAIDPDWRVFARSASDSKGPMTQFLLAIDAIDKAGLATAYNLKVIVDTEEEKGSPNLADAVAANRDVLAADFLLIFDGPPHASNRPTIAFGARGVTTITLTSYGPKTPQHSGHYGNFAPNPAFHLARILASMKSADGRVRIKGFYDGVKVPKDVRAALAAVPDDEAAILKGMGLAEADKVAPSLQEALQYPALNIRGLDAAWVGKEARTIIPATAIAEIDIRTVKETDPERLVALVRKHIEKEGYYVIDRAPTAEERAAHPRIVSFVYNVSYAAFRSDFDAPPGLLARAGMRRLYGEEP
ncbi:MAG: M20/M25/M40 family metallo-hydrolase, partial [Parvularculaceae bacterium]